MLNVCHLVTISLAGVCLLKTIVCHPYLEEFDNMCDNSVSSPYDSPYNPVDFDSPPPPYPPPVDRFSPDDEYGPWRRPASLHRRLRPIRIPTAPARQIIYRDAPRCPAPIIIEHKAPRPQPTLLSPITTLINSVVKSIFPQNMNYYGDY